MECLRGIQFFLRKVVSQSQTDLTSFRIQFEKIGRGLLTRCATMFTSFFQDRSFFISPSLFWLTKHSPSHWKASRNNPCSIFSNCLKNDVTLVWLCLMTFRKKAIVYYCLDLYLVVTCKTFESRISLSEEFASSCFHCVFDHLNGNSHEQNAR